MDITSANIRAAGDKFNIRTGNNPEFLLVEATKLNPSALLFAKGATVAINP